MNEYICFWVDKCHQIDSWEIEKKYILSDLCFPLSSRYNVNSKRIDNNGIEILISENENIPKNYLGDKLVDLKAFVGENGVGKTTVMRKLYQLITAGDHSADIGCDYILIYKNGGNFFYKSTIPNVSAKIIVRTTENDCVANEISIRPSNANDYKAKWAIWYASAFYDHEQVSLNYEGSMNLQSNGLFWSDNEHLNNHSSSYYDLYNKINPLSLFYAMEQNRFVDFFLDGVEYFSGKYRFPDTILVSPMEINIDNALVEWSARRFDEKSLDEPLPDESKKNQEKQEYVKSEKRNWKTYYNHLSFDDKVRFSALLSFCRTFKAYVSDDKFSTKDAFIDLWDNAIKWIVLTDIPGDGEAILEHVESRFLELKELVEKIIVCYKDNNITVDEKLWFNYEKDKGCLKEIKKLYGNIFKLTPFLDFRFNRPLSSGEHSFLKFYYRLYHAFKSSNRESRSNEITLFIDEADLFLHPSWQQEWLSYFIDGMNYLEDMLKNNVDNNKNLLLDQSEHLNIQLFISTHSPFMISELMNEHVVFMNHKENNPMESTEIVGYKIDNLSANIFGANMFDLLGGGFFLKGTIGKYAEKKIIDIVNKKRRGENINDDEKKLIKKIGDPVIRSLLEEVEVENV